MSSSLKVILNLTDQVASQIVSLAPVVLFDGLDRKQAQAVVEAMADVTAAGGKLAVSNAPPGAMRKVNWPKLPTIGGRAVATFVSGVVPAVGVPPGAAGAPPPPPAGAPAAAPAHPAPPGTVRGVVTKCPVCGAALTIAAAGAVAQTPAPRRIARPAAPPPSARPRRKPPTRPPAPPSPGDMSTGLTPKPGTLRAAAPSPAPPKRDTGGVIIEEVASIDDLDLGGPQPDVPVVPSDKPRPAAQQPDAQAAASALAPMDLDDFEAGLLAGGEDQLLADLDANLPDESASEDLLAELDELPGIEVQAEPADSNLPGDAPAPAPAGPEPGDWNVFASKASGVDLPAVISQVMGIPIGEAQALSKKPVVPVAKNVSKASAEEIRDRLSAANVKARISRKARSSRGKRR